MTLLVQIRAIRPLTFFSWKQHSIFPLSIIRKYLEKSHRCNEKLFAKIKNFQNYIIFEKYKNSSENTFFDILRRLLRIISIESLLIRHTIKEKVEVLLINMMRRLYGKSITVLNSSLSSIVVINLFLLFIIFLFF